MEKINATEENVVILGDVKFVIEKDKKESAYTINTYTFEDEPKHLDRFYDVILEDNTLENIKNFYDVLKVYVNTIKEVCSEYDVELPEGYTEHMKIFVLRDRISEFDFSIDVINTINARFEEKLKEFDYKFISKGKIEGYYMPVPLYRNTRSPKAYMFFKGPAIRPYGGKIMNIMNNESVEEIVSDYMEYMLASIYSDIIECARYRNQFCYELTDKLDNISKVTHKELMDNVNFIIRNIEILDNIERNYKADSITLSCGNITKTYDISKRELLHNLDKYKIKFYEEFKNKIFKLAILGHPAAINDYTPYSKLLKDMVNNQYNYSPKECDIELNKVRYLLEITKDTKIEKCEDGRISFSTPDSVDESKEFRVDDISDQEEILHMKVKYTLRQYRATSAKYIKILQNFPSDTQELFDILLDTKLVPPYKVKK